MHAEDIFRGFRESKGLSYLRYNFVDTKVIHDLRRLELAAKPLSCGKGYRIRV